MTLLKRLYYALNARYWRRCYEEADLIALARMYRLGNLKAENAMLCRHRDDAATRASDATIDAGRLEERLRHAERALELERAAHQVTAASLEEMQRGSAADRGDGEVQPKRLGRSRADCTWGP